MDNPGRVRRIFDSLPEPANWTDWIKFTILQTGAYKPFLRQCSNNTTCRARSRRDERPKESTWWRAGGQDAERAPTPLAQALSWKRLALIHYRISLSLYLVMLAKYRLIGMLSGDFRSLDCFILGRLRGVGRLNKIGGEFACLFILGYLANRVSIHLLEPNFKFYVLEFLMSSRSEILGYEAAESLRRLNGKRQKFRRFEIDVLEQQRRPESACPLLTAPTVGNEIYLAPRHRPRLLTAGGSTDNLKHQDDARPIWNSIMYLRCPFTTTDEIKWILRPNRSAKSWARLKFYTKILFYWSIFNSFSSVALINFITSGAILTNLGFEMSYPACVAWLRDVQSAPGESNYTRNIYLAPKVLAHEIPIDDIPARIPLDTRSMPQASLYAIARISMDILENQLIYLDGAGLFVCQFYLVIIYSIDIVLNASEIKLRLIKLLEKLEARGASSPTREMHQSRLLATTGSPLRAHSYERHLLHSPHRPRAPVIDSSELGEEILEMQAILADHFNTITQGYNLNISFVLSIVGLCWLLYTVIVCIWIGSNRSRAVEFEFVVAELMTTIFCSMLTIGTAFVRSRNLQLYPLITRAMALDPDWSLTKRRWISILSYFYPKSFYCFTIFGSIELSALLGLKLMSWILSAFIVLANFFHASRF